MDSYLIMAKGLKALEELTGSNFQVAWCCLEEAMFMHSAVCTSEEIKLLDKVRYTLENSVDVEMN